MTVKNKLIDIEQILEQVGSGQITREQAVSFLGSEIKELQFQHYNEKNKPLKTLENFECLLNYKDIQISYNEISRCMEIEGTEFDGINDGITQIFSYCMEESFNLTKNNVIDFSEAIAKRNTYNPVYDFLVKAMRSWDGVSRIKILCDTLITTNDFDPEFKMKLIRTWLIGAVKIVNNTLTSQKYTDGILVLQGGQGVGKTTWIKMIIPDNLKRYFKDGIQLDVKDKDSIYEATSNWIVELGELDGTLKREQASLKAFFTKTCDVQRRPYQVKEEIFPRRTAFFGTVNDEEFLKDPTGSRRYWIIPVIGIHLEDLKNIDLVQLWGEVMTLAIQEPTGHILDRETMAQVNKSNEDYNILSTVQLKVQSHFDWNAPKEFWHEMKTADIADKLALKTSKGLRQAIEECGGEYKRTLNTRGYLVPPFKSVYNL